MQTLNALNIPFEFDHVGIAVTSLQEAEAFYRALGFTESHTEEVPSEKVRVRMFELKNQSRIELLESTDPNGPVGRFVAKHGPGIHHICLRVKGLQQILEKLKKEKIQLIHQEPIRGAHNCNVAFIHPRATGGVLLELSEPQGRGS